MPQHLDDVEIEALLDWSEERGGEFGAPPVRSMEEARTHLAGCSECDRKLRTYRDAHNRLVSLRLPQEGSRPGNCSEKIDWTAVAAGLLPEGEANAHLEHASKCLPCGNLLKTAIADLYVETTPEEEAIHADLKSSTVEWQIAFANQLRHRTGYTRSASLYTWRLLQKPALLVFAAVLTIAFVGTLIAFRHSRSSNPMDLIATAYSEHRTMELRIPGAAYSPVRLKRGRSASNLDRPAALLQAEEIIHEGLLKSPDDPTLLDAKARADLLDGNYDSAVDALQRALEGQPQSNALMTDLATAYFMRAETTKSAIDYGRAIDELGTVLSASPDDSVALFNRAVAEERLNLPDRAKADWMRFLQVEKDPGWLAEGRARYDAVSQYVDKHEHLSWFPQHNPADSLSVLRARALGLADKDPNAPLDEVYLNYAMTKWLPSLVSLPSHSEQSVARGASVQVEALETLASNLRGQHGDVWLSELLFGPRSRVWAAGILELTDAERANSEGNVSEIIPHAAQAIRFFRQSKNMAGESAARFELLRGFNRSVQAGRCHSASLDALRLSKIHHYIWIEAYSLLEASTCSFMIGRQEAALDYARQATTLAQQSDYKILVLKGAFFLDGVATTSVATPDAWDRIQAGLTEFWRSSYPPQAGGGFYADLGFAAQSEGLWHCAERVEEELLVVDSADGNQFVIASTHHRLAKAAEAVGDDALAEVEYRSAGEILSRLGKSANLARIEFDIERAAQEVRQSKFSLASAHLDALAADLPTISNHYALIPYFESVGELHLNTGKPRQAEKELLAAIQLIEQDKSSLLSETDLLSWQRDTSQAYRSLLLLYSQAYHNDSETFSCLEWYRASPLRGAAAGRALTNPRINSISGPFAFSQFIPEKLKLPDHTALLTWISFPTRLSVFLLNDSGLHTATVDVGEGTFDAAARRLIRLCSDPLSDRVALDHEAQQLYQWLVQPVAAQLLGTRKLLIEPDDFFSFIPFELLETPQQDYLGDLLSISESPGIGYAQLLRTDGRISPRSIALVVGDPLLSREAATRFRPLPDTGREAADVAANFDRHFVLTAGDASLQNVRKLLPQSEVFHFAGHAASEGNQTGLVLSSVESDPEQTVLLDQKQLRREDLKNLKLVILSGCETGIADRGLVDPESLVRVFLRAGVPEVVASRWQIDSQSSAELMKVVYSGLMQGSTVNQALAAAKRNLRSRPQTAHPYYWAAFSVFGR